MLRDFEKKILGLPRTQEEKNQMVASLGTQIREHAVRLGSLPWHCEDNKNIVYQLRSKAIKLRQIAEYPVSGRKR